MKMNSSCAPPVASSWMTKAEKRIRSLKLRSGRAAFRLVSESSPKIVTVSVFSRDPLLSKAEIQVEFV